MSHAPDNVYNDPRIRSNMLEKLQYAQSEAPNMQTGRMPCMLTEKLYRPE
jgi:hypothetical protein